MIPRVFDRIKCEKGGGGSAVAFHLFINYMNSKCSHSLKIMAKKPGCSYISWLKCSIITLMNTLIYPLSLCFSSFAVHVVTGNPDNDDPQGLQLSSKFSVGVQYPRTEICQAQVAHIRTCLTNKQRLAPTWLYYHLV